jgi:hypothetical protein
MPTYRVPFTVVFEGFVEIEAPPPPPRPQRKRGGGMEIGEHMKWADAVTVGVSEEVQAWLKERANFKKPISGLTVRVDYETGHNELLRKSSGAEIY